jgi:predicted Zn-dependent protease
MSYSNPKIPEGINVSEERPIRDFFVLLSGILVTIVCVAFVLSLVAQEVALRIPFSIESELTAPYVQNFVDERPDSDTEAVIVEQYLQQLAEKLAEAQGLPVDMVLHVHYLDDDTVNAFATLGGNIMIHRGLMEKMPHENALSMVLAHEIAHIYHRDPIVSLGRGLTVALAMAVFLGASGSGVFEGILGKAGLLTTLSFSRTQEHLADQRALETLLVYYGHTRGATALFDVIQEQQEMVAPPAFLGSHPLTDDRIKEAEAFELIHGQTGSADFVPLPGPNNS